MLQLTENLKFWIIFPLEKEKRIGLLTVAPGSLPRIQFAGLNDRIFFFLKLSRYLLLDDHTPSRQR